MTEVGEYSEVFKSCILGYQSVKTNHLAVFAELFFFLNRAVLIAEMFKRELKSEFVLCTS